nr:unnamed protein product [Callosobruchus chinensis]
MKRAIPLIGDPALMCHLQPLSHRRGVRLVTSHSSTDIQTEAARLSYREYIEIGV